MKKKITALISVVLLFALLYALLTTVVLASEPDNYAKPGVTEKTTLSSADVLSEILGYGLCETERKYLELYGDYSLSYGSNIPSSVVQIERYESTGEFSVIASVYEYFAENGVRVTFVPSEVTVGTKTLGFAFDGVRYIADFDASDYDENDTDARARVKYKAEIEIPERVASALMTKAYGDAVYWENTVNEKNEEYSEALRSYNESCIRYEQYLQALADYEVARALYDKYKVDKALYDRYAANLLEWEKYEQDLETYEKYLKDMQDYNEKYAAYREYLQLKDRIEELRLEYQTYLTNIETVRQQIAILDGLKHESTELDRSIYSAVIIGTTVTEVLLNKDAIANQAVGVDPGIVDMAGESTDRLRELFNAYFEIQSEADKYVYYLLNYEAIRSNFTDLFLTLDKMYQNSKVRLALKEKGLQEKYEILLAQLYYVVLALNDGPVYNYDKTATYGSGYVVNTITKATPLVLLDYEPYVIDFENAEPLSTGYPVEVKEPVFVETEEPIMPTYVPMPIEPERVEPVEEPTVVLMPSVPAAAEAPGEAPVPYEPEAIVSELILAYRRGELDDALTRDTVGARKITLEIGVNKPLSDKVDKCRVEFKDLDGNTLYVVEIDKGTYAEYEGLLPTKREDARATYEFVGWSDSPGGSVYNVSEINSDVVLYPVFREKIRSYTVAWVIEGEIIQTQFSYGDMPSCPVTPVKESDDTYEYLFLGNWGREILPVTGTAIYFATFESVPYYTNLKGESVAVSKTGNEYYVDCKNTQDESFDISNLITRVTENDSIILESKSCKVTLSPDGVYLMKRMGATGVGVESLVMSAGGGHMLSVYLFNDEGTVDLDDPSLSWDILALLSATAISVEKPMSFESYEPVKFYYLDAEKRRQPTFTYDSCILDIDCILGKTYYAIVEYPINVMGGSDVEISISPESKIAKRGDKIEVSVVKLPDGAVLDEIFYVDPDGERILITDGYFYMCGGVVSVGVTYHIPTYKVTYIADGKTIYSVVLKIGEVASEPPIPTKSADEEYSYTFVEWIGTVDPETGDVVYEARYMKVKLPEKEVSKGIEILPGIYINVTASVLHIIAKIFIAAFYGGVVFVPLVTIIIIKNTRRSSR